jgi:hypothetical protein
MAQQKTLYPKISFCATTINWSYGGCLWIYINVAAGYSFHVNWGDGKQERFIGEGKSVTLFHDYFPGIRIPERGIPFRVEIFSNEKNCRITEFVSPNDEMDVPELDIRHCVELEWLCHNMTHDPTTLDLSKNTALRRLNCESAKLSELDVSNNTELVVLNCSHNGLQKLDLSNNRALQYLDCRWNNLSEIDISKNTKLVGLDCGDTGLKTLDLSNNPALEYLNCQENDLSEIDISKNTKLVGLDCYHTGLKTLDLSNNPALKYLNCQNNTIKTLDLSNNPALRALDCTDNEMCKLFVGHDSKLQEETFFMKGNHIDANTEKSIMGIIESNPPEEYDEWFNKFDRCLQLPW